MKSTTMKEQVYEILQTIPAGKVMTYGQVAERLGNKYYARTVGNILHQNPNPETIPCHRVVSAQGKVAEHYAFGGAEAQRMKLEAEGIVFDEKGCVDLKKYGVELMQ